MDGFFIARVISDFLFGYSTLFAVVNPLGVALVFQDTTRGLDAKSRRQLAARIASYSFVILFVSLLLGARILTFFGISLAALNIAGGLAVCVLAWRLLSASTPTEGQPLIDRTAARRQAFFPLTMPLTTGPGTIATAITLGATHTGADQEKLAIAIVSTFIVSIAIFATIWLSYRNAGSIARRLGTTGALVIGKLTAFLLLCVGVQIVLAGVAATVQPLGLSGR